MTHSRLSVVACLVASSLCLPARGQAAIITADGALCTLADAIRAANTDGIAGGCTAGGGADTIQLTADESLTFAEAGASGSTDIFGGIAGLPDVVSTITIQANGAGDRIERQAGLVCGGSQPDAFRIVNILGAGNLTLVGITVANGCIAPPAAPAYGGGFYLAATGALTLQQATVSGNTASGFHDVNAAGALASGGGVYASGGTVTLTTASFDGNHAFGGDGGQGGGTALGGALAQEGGTLIATDASFTGNSAVGGFGDGGGSASGGAVFLSGTTAASFGASSFVGNTAQGGGATNITGDGEGGGITTVVSASVTALTLSTFADNVAAAGSGGGGATVGGSASGGGLHLDGGANGVFDRLTVRDNRAEGGSGSATGGPALGGGLNHAAVSLAGLRESQFTGNIARGGDGSGQAGIGAAAAGGGLAASASISALTLSTFADNVAAAGSGTGGASVGGSANGGGLHLAGGANGAFEQLIVRDNRAEGGSGGAIGGPAFGGGMDHSAQSLAALRSSHFAGNIARAGHANGQAGIGAAAAGGGLAVAGALAEISGSTFNGNRSEAGDGLIFGGFANGGGLELQSASALLVSNTTVYDNVAQAGTSAGAGHGDARGGGLSGGGPLTVVSHATVVANQAISPGAGTGGGLSGTFTVGNTVLADNQVTGTPATGPDCSGTVVSSGFNHVEDAAGGCAFGATNDVVDSDPLLGPFGDHGCTANRALPGGGCAPTVALLLSSLPLDAGSCAVSGATVDERGFPRPVDIPAAANAAEGCDKGAFELQGLEAGVDLAITKTGPPADPAVGAPFSFLLSVTNQSTIASGTGITVTDSVPAGLFYTGSSCGAVAAGGVVTWTIGALAPGAAVTCDFNFQRTSRSAISNQATVDGNEVDPDGTDNVATAQLEALQVPAIPTLGGWAMLLMTLSLAALAVSRLRG